MIFYFCFFVFESRKFHLAFHFHPVSLEYQFARICYRFWTSGYRLWPWDFRWDSRCWFGIREWSLSLGKCCRPGMELQWQHPGDLCLRSSTALQRSGFETGLGTLRDSQCRVWTGYISSNNSILMNDVVTFVLCFTPQCFDLARNSSEILKKLLW